MLNKNNQGNRKNEKKLLISVILIIIIICIIFIIFIVKNNNSIDDSSNIVITRYRQGTDKVVKKIAINDENDIDKLSKYIEELKPIPREASVGLALAKEIEIKYYDSITIGIQLGEKSYCYYINKEKDISSLSMIPEGLYEWVEEKIY